MKASELIRHLEDGDLLARKGGIGSFSFLRLEEGTYLGAYGWGSAYSQSREAWLIDVLLRPDRWLPVSAEGDCYTHDAAATVAFAEARAQAAPAEGER